MNQYTVKIKGLNVREIYKGGGFSNVYLEEVSIVPFRDGVNWVVTVDGTYIANTEAPFDALRDHINKRLQSAKTM